MGRLTTYCDKCGQEMLSSEVNMSFNRHRCGCGNAYTSYDENYIERRKMGLVMRFRKKKEELVILKKCLEESSNERITESIKALIDKAKFDIHDVREQIKGHDEHTFCDVCARKMRTRWIIITDQAEPLVRHHCDCGNRYNSKDPNYHLRRTQGRELHEAKSSR